MKYFGYIKEEKKPEDYVFGSYSKVPNIELRPDHDWRGVRPLYELQAPKFETYACVSETTTKIEAKLAKQIFNAEENWSARFLAAITDTDVKGGNSPGVVAEARRKLGSIAEYLYPTEKAETFEDYYKEISYSVRCEARKIPRTRDFLHDIVPSDPEAVYDALRFSPLGAGVYAWVRDGEYYIFPDGAQPNHDTTIVFGKKEEYFIIEDSY